MAVKTAFVLPFLSVQSVDTLSILYFYMNLLSFYGPISWRVSFLKYKVIRDGWMDTMLSLEIFLVIACYPHTSIYPNKNKYINAQGFFAHIKEWNLKAFTLVWCSHKVIFCFIIWCASHVKWRLEMSKF